MKKYQLIYADPPWKYKPLKGVSKQSDGTYLSRNDCGADAHYPLMNDEELLSLNVKSISEDKSALFMWATCPRLDFAIDLMREWGFYYRGVAYIWVKVNKDGNIMGAKGPPPAFVKPVTELVIVGSTVKAGRVWPLHDYKQNQVIMEPRGAHSAKPSIVRKNIEKLSGNVSKIELFAREKVKGWDSWGNEVDSDISFDKTKKRIVKRTK